MTSACAVGNESEGLLREGDDVIIEGGDCELEIGGDVIDGAGVPGTTSEEALEKIERPGVMKEGKAGHEINGGGDTGNNVVKKGSDRFDGYIDGGDNVVCSAQCCNKKGMQAIASGILKRIKEGVAGTEPSTKKAKYCLGCLAIKKDTKNRNININRIKIKEEKEGLVLPKCL